MHHLRATALLLLISLAGFAQNTPPVLGTFAWINQGTCIGAQNPSGTMTMFHPGAVGLGFNWCTLQKALPGAPYTVIVGLQGHIMGKSASLGLTLRDDISGKQIVYSIGSSDTGVSAIAGWKMNSPTLYVAPPYFSYSVAAATGGLLPKYLRIKDNGAGLRTLAVSHDKEVWLTIHIVASNDFILPTHWGFALRGTGDNLASLMTVFHEQVTTP